MQANVKCLFIEMHNFQAKFRFFLNGRTQLNSNEWPIRHRIIVHDTNPDENRYGYDRNHRYTRNASVIDVGFFRVCFKRHLNEMN